jgi:hypothetical protein
MTLYVMEIIYEHQKGLTEDTGLLMSKMNLEALASLRG